MATLLIVEDDPVHGELASRSLVSKGHRVDWVTTGGQGKEYLLAKEYEAVILDWELPEMSGLDLLKFIRQKQLGVAVLMLTSRQTIQDKEAGFETGADDYLTKPYDTKELTVRVAALLRRPREYKPLEIRMGDLCLSAEERRAQCKGRLLELQPKEFALLEFLLKHPNRVFAVDTLLESVWNDEDAGEMAVRVVVARLRKKLSEAGSLCAIRTVHGAGYKLESESK